MRPIGAVAFAAALFVSAPAHAGPPSTTKVIERPEPARENGSWFFGGAVGFGSLGADALVNNTSYGSLFGSLHFGGMVRPKLALVAEAWASGWEDTQDTAGTVFNQAYQANLGVGLQWWAFDDFWVKGIVATSILHLDGEDRAADDLDGASVLGAIGYELWENRLFALDVQTRVSLSSYGEDQQTTSAAVQLGFTVF